MLMLINKNNLTFPPPFSFLAQPFGWFYWEMSFRPRQIVFHQSNTRNDSEFENDGE